mgnify:CR=1 FL=1
MHLLITAGPTWEPIDAVRYVGNRSSGRMGLAIIDAAIRRGWPVTALLGPGLPDPAVSDSLNVHRFESCADLEALLAEHFPGCDLLIMAAAVADYRPAEVHTGKLHRETTGDLTLHLEPTPDLVAACAARKRDDQRILAFALEDPAVLHQRAAEKLHRKGVDAIIANPLQTMAASHVDATLLLPDGTTHTPGPTAKPAFADWLIDQLDTSPK